MSYILPLATNPLDRFQGMRSDLVRSADEGVPFLQIILVLGAIAVLVTLLAVSVCLRRRHVARKGFRQAVERAGLEKSESNLLALLARYAGLVNPSAIFTLDHAFDDGVAGVLQSDRYRRLSPQMREGTLDLLAKLRMKLGFHVTAPRHSSRIKIERIAPLTPLEVIRRQSPNHLHVSIAEGAARPNEATLLPQPPVQVQAGENWLLKYSQAGLECEFVTRVLQAGPEKVRVGLVQTQNGSSRRRFARANVLYPAWLARFSYEASGSEMPRFLAASVIQSAGPGLLLLESQGNVQVGERVLVVMSIHPGKTVQSLGIVRRCSAGKGALQTLAVELTGLSNVEVADLARETNLALVHAGAADTTGAAAGPAETLKPQGVN